MSGQILKIVNFDKYQHYKGEHIIWIKLYVKLLHDMHFMSLTEGERWFFISLLLLAGECKNSINYNPNFLEKILNTSEIEKKVGALIDIKLIELLYNNSRQISIEKIREEKIRKDKIEYRQLIVQFCTKYNLTTGHTYQANYPRDIAILKQIDPAILGGELFDKYLAWWNDESWLKKKKSMPIIPLILTTMNDFMAYGKDIIPKQSREELADPYKYAKKKLAEKVTIK